MTSGQESDPKGVLDKLVCSLEWREANNVDGILASNLLGELQYTFPVYFGSVDSANRPGKKAHAYVINSMIDMAYMYVFVNNK